MMEYYYDTSVMILALFIHYVFLCGNSLGHFQKHILKKERYLHWIYYNNYNMEGIWISNPKHV